MSTYKISFQNQSHMYTPQFAGNQIRNATSVLLKKNSPLAPGQNYKLTELKLSLDTPIDLFFWKTKFDEVPLFFNIMPNALGKQGFNQQDKKILLNESLYHEVLTVYTKDISPENQMALDLDNAISKSVNVEVHLVMEHKRFHPNPQVSIFGKAAKTKQLILLKTVEIWDWFEKEMAENQVKFEFIQKE